MQLTAVPAGGSFFTGWSGACSGVAATCTVSMTAAVSVTATFAPTAVVEVEVRNPLVALTHYGTSTVTGPGGFSCSQSGPGSTVCRLVVAADVAPVTFQAVPDLSDGDAFAGWSGPCSGAAPTCTFVPRAGTVFRVTAGFSD